METQSASFAPPAAPKANGWPEMPTTNVSSGVEFCFYLVGTYSLAVIAFTNWSAVSLCVCGEPFLACRVYVVMSHYL